MKKLLEVMNIFITVVVLVVSWVWVYIQTHQNV